MKKRLEDICHQLESLEPSLVNGPRIVAVSKRQTIDKIETLFALGVRDFGENYVQEASEKIEKLKHLDIEWHFIGQLQRKKLKDIVGRFHWIHSLDRVEVAQKLSDLAVSREIQQKVLVQVNIAQEASKGGVAPEDVKTFLKEIAKLPALDVRGLMLFPPLAETNRPTSDWYSQGCKLLKTMKPLLGDHFCELSMGTSSDYLRAARAGSTMLRLGEVLMGPRPVL